MITDPEAKKQLRAKYIKEYKELTGETLLCIEKKRRRCVAEYRYVATQHLLEISCEYLGVSREQVVGPSRKQSLVKCRQTISYLLDKMHTKQDVIGNILGYKDHSTVTYNIETVKGYLKVDKEYKEQYEKYKECCLEELERRMKKNNTALSDEQIVAIQYSVKKGGITHKELADIYGVARSTISKYTKVKRTKTMKNEKERSRTKVL